MATRPQIQVNVPPPPRPLTSQPGKETGTMLVQQALQYTPLTTSVLPAHDRIPLPQICRSKEMARLTSSNERKDMQQTLSQFPVAKLRDKLSSFLNPRSLAEFKFTQFPTENINARNAVSGPPNKPEYVLSSTAQMVLDMSRIDHIYPSRGMPIKRHQPIDTQPSLQELPSGIQMQSPQHQTAQESPRLPTPVKSPVTVKSADSGPLVVQIPKPSPSFRREDYTEALDSSKRRKLSHDEIAVEVPLRVRSQREASDAVLLQFQNNLMEVFEAQDQLDAGSANAQGTGFFDVVEDGDSSEPRLSSKTLERLQISLRKLVDLQRMQDVSVEHLRRLQRLCEPAIDFAQTVNLVLVQDHSADDQEHWRQKLIEIETGVVSASICLYTMIGCPHEESLLLSDVRSWIPNVIVNLFDNCLIPVVEARADNDTSFFVTATLNKNMLKRLLDHGKKMLDIMTTLCTDTKGSGTLVNPVEFLCAKLIFVQNAVTDKNSCLGIQSYEKVRQTAMSCLARIYARFPSERRTILDEILTSVDKLPSNSRSARQYRLGDGKSVQLITALFVQLVQTTSLEMPSNESKAKRRPLANDERSVNGSADEDTDEMNVDNDKVLTKNEGPITRLQKKADTLFEASARSAKDIVSYLVTRASKTTKTGDSPYRSVLDLFIEDLVAMLPSPEWPASELMLRMLSQFMMKLANNDKSAATKNMALESLGVMGSAISELKASIPDLASVLERDAQHQSEVSRTLCRFANIQETVGSLQSENILYMEGPFALVTRQLSADTGYSLQSRSACGYFVAHYAKLLTLSRETQGAGQDDIEAPPVRVANWLLDLIPKIGTDSIDTHKFDAVNTEEAELAYALCVLNVGFCSGLYNIGRTLTASFTSDQAQVRTRSLKSVQTMLEKDSSLMNNESIVDSVFICAADDSALVRDAALSLIAKFIVSRPRLRKKGIQRLLECASDSKVGVQKKSMIHLKDVYLNDDDKALRAIISRTFLERTKDHEDTVADLARKTLLELWISPMVQSLSDSVESRRKIAIENLSKEIVQCVTANSIEMSILLQKFLLAALSDTKAASGVRQLCSKLVEELFEKTISGTTDHGSLETLSAFAAADSQLIPPSRLAKLKHYLTNIRTDEDLYMFKSVIKIFRSVLPGLSATHRNLLQDIQVDLLKSISALGRRIDLDPLMTCIWTIESVLGNPARLVNLTASVFNQIKQLRDKPPNVARLLRIAGAIARYMDLDTCTDFFATRLKEEVQGGAVSKHMASVFLDHTKSTFPLEIRVSALESLGSLCQANPILFNKPSIRKTFFSVFDDEITSTQVSDALRHIVLCLLDELYASRAQTKEESEDSGHAGEQQDLSKLGGDSKTRDGDSAVVSITGEVVQHILEVALNTQGDGALLAARTLASISHEGLIHPKQSTGAFVALGTSSDARVAEIASTAQRLLHQTHESVCEREYMQAIQQAFTYQNKVFNDTCGARPDSYTAKLARCFEIINISNSKYVKKFLSGLLTRIANDLAAQDKKGHTRQHVEFARFVLQNIAFFDYKKLDDLLHTILQLELAYSKGGGEVVQQLETSMSSEPVPGEQDQTHPADQDVTIGSPQPSEHGDIVTIRRLAPIAATLTLLMETRAYLRRQYGVGQDVRAAINTHKQLKDNNNNKGLVKVHGITGERIWTRTNSIVASLDSDKDMITCCKSFVALMNVAEADIEVDNSLADEKVEPSVPYTNGHVRAGTPGARKRKGSVSVGNTPVKKARARARKEVKRSASISSMEDPEADFDG